jgi:hypothetical protein
MKERIVKIEKSKAKNKKYTAFVGDGEKTRKIHFGHSDYEQYKDTTGKGAFSSKNHLDTKRREAYFSRHSGTKNKADALRKEKNKSGGKYNAKILSHKFLW